MLSKLIEMDAALANHQKVADEFLDKQGEAVLNSPFDQATAIRAQKAFELRDALVAATAALHAISYQWTELGFDK